MWSEFHKAIQLIRDARRVAVLTGAGISTLSGIPDFRGGAGDSFYDDPVKMKTFDLNWFDLDPSIFYRNVRPLMDRIFSARPNVVHEMVARLERLGKVAGVVTQNIDHLHQAAGSRNVLEMHGSCAGAHCRACGAAIGLEDLRRRMAEAEVPRCACGGAFKPDVTFFREPLPAGAMHAARELVESVDLLLVLGTSLTVQPVATLPGLAMRHLARLVIVNAQPTPKDGFAAARHADLAAFAYAVLDAFPYGGAA